MTPEERDAILARLDNAASSMPNGQLPETSEDLQSIAALLAALEDAERERAALAAVIEQVRSCRHDTKPSGGMMGEIWYDVRGVDRILTTAPTDALETVKAEAWDEGVDRAYSGMIMRQNAAEVKRTNPHRKTDTKGGE